MGGCPSLVGFGLPVKFCGYALVQSDAGGRGRRRGELEGPGAGQADGGGVARGRHIGSGGAPGLVDEA